ncbi:MAG: type II toxin-antitoxin system prevent-host-death family antitoxin [Rhodospirillaceae bacterium]|nr:type II toxin-antitoxin system prevent-host-death family antitoxin [Rhodospirillaceae bacterium]
MNKIVSYSVARQNLASVMDEACSSRAPITVTRRGSQPVVIMSLEEYNAMDETMHLTRSPANAAYLRRAIADAEKGKLIKRDLIDWNAKPKKRGRKK